MKCTIPEISWHNRQPVLSVDIQQIEQQADVKFYRLASGGSDTHILIWMVRILDNGAPGIELLSDLTRHQKAVNVVRWSPDNQFLASADDDAYIILWTLKLDSIPSLDGEDNNRETWIVNKVLRGHKEDVYDMCWSPDGARLLTGSIDNTAIVWNVAKGKNEFIITDHKSFVQGVAWNPHKPHYLATLSSDRTCRILDAHPVSGRYAIRHRIVRGTLPLPTQHPFAIAMAATGAVKDVKYFHDDTFRTYFRRLTFSPDGRLLLVPSGYAEVEGRERGLYGTYVFATTGKFDRPAAILASPRQSSIAVRCCPLLFELRPSGPEPYIQLPYRMVIAVATDSDVVLYDTQQTAPFAHLQNIHYARLTDLSWSGDGRVLIAASADGFCAIVTFDVEELGRVYVKEESETEESVLNISGCELIDVSTAEVEPQFMAVIEPEVKRQKKPSFLDQWTANSGKKPKTESHTSEKSLQNASPNKTSSPTKEPMKKPIGTDLFPSCTSSSTKSASVSVVEPVYCEFIDLSSSLSNDSQKFATQKRITPILISTPKSADVKPIRRIIPTLVSKVDKDEDQAVVAKRRIVPTLICSATISKKESTPRNLEKPVDGTKTEILNEVIDLTENKRASLSVKRSASATVTTKSPPSGKKLKTNTLLNFIQRSSSKPIAKKTSKAASASSKGTKAANSINTVSNMPIEESARDAWQCEQSNLSTITDVTEDIPEDFKLQLEQSTNTNLDKSQFTNTDLSKSQMEPTNVHLDISKMLEDNNDKPVSESSKDESDTTALAIGNGNSDQNDVSFGNTNKEKQELTAACPDVEPKLNSALKPLEKENNEDVSQVEDKTVKLIKSEESIPVKRRVPLITLSSPKNKKPPMESKE